MVNSTEHLSGRVFVSVVQLLILISVISFSVDTLPDLSAGTHRMLSILEKVTVLVFTFEYVLRLAVAQKKWKFVFSFYGLVDLTAILPFYLATGLDLRAVRVVRFLRLVRILKLLKYNQAVGLFYRAFLLSKEQLALFGFAVSILLYLSAVGIYYFESAAQPDQFKSVFHCLWWAVTTLTTVGYGDMYPITPGGRVFTCVVLLIGLAVIAVPTGLFASALTRAREDEVCDEDGP